ncbi:hypothetical protein D3C75_642150 [compost metagenome]
MIWRRTHQHLAAIWQHTVDFVLLRLLIKRSPLQSGISIDSIAEIGLSDFKPGDRRQRLNRVVSIMDGELADLYGIITNHIFGVKIQ